MFHADKVHKRSHRETDQLANSPRCLFQQASANQMLDVRRGQDGGFPNPLRSSKPRIKGTVPRPPDEDFFVEAVVPEALVGHGLDRLDVRSKC